MGYSILELVLRQLRQANFVTNVAYPGQKFPQISGTVASVHIEKADRANLTVTVGVNIISQASLGGTACEVEALRATEALRWSRAVCVQSGCRYDGIAQVYVVEILATYTGVTEEDNCKIWPGFYATINDIIHPHAIAFTEEEVVDTQAEYVMGQDAPVGISTGKKQWKIMLEELIPSGSPEQQETNGAFELLIETEDKTERYAGCQWTSIKREFTRQGLRLTRTGVALTREVL